ncbi:hypothetical protein RIF29_40753 [Crotalaria pallida]|uniref:Uncharacterized protein n=1 Tax=Crotalaria pallida TaxID=3830 RepID=A0AAN9E3S5_CROPI
MGPTLIDPNVAHRNKKEEREYISSILRVTLFSCVLFTLLSPHYSKLRISLYLLLSLSLMTLPCTTSRDLNLNYYSLLLLLFLLSFFPSTLSLPLPFSSSLFFFPIVSMLLLHALLHT